MKYYKLLTKDGLLDNFWVLDKIYPQNAHRIGHNNVSVLVSYYPSDWQEVSAGDYYIQEGKLPKDYIVECNNAQESTTVLNNNGNYNKQWSWWKYCYTDKEDPTGFLITNNIKECPANYPLFTFEQWNKLINKNMKEEFVLPEKWAVKRTPKNADILNNWANSQPGVSGTSSNGGWIHSINYGYFGHSRGGHYCADDIKHSDHTEITFEQFEKYVLKKEDMKEIIGYKLKECCEQYEEAAIQIMGFKKGGRTSFEEWLKRSSDGGFVRSLRKAGVLDLWFEPVYEEKFKVGDWVYWFGEDAHVGKIHHHCPSFRVSWCTKKLKNGRWNSCSEAYLRKATEKEILKHLQTEFTKRTGIDIDSVVAPNKILGEIVFDEDNKHWEASYVMGNRKVLEFKLHVDNTLLLQISGTYKSIWYNAEAMQLVPALTFGGYDVTFEKVTSGVRITCNGETGTLSQIEKIYDFFKKIEDNFKFGSSEVIRVDYEEYKWFPEFKKAVPINITIGCTTGTWKEFCDILKAAKKLEND